MDRSRWIAFGVSLAVLFLASMAVGAFVGRQRGPSAPSAVASPSPAPPTASPTPTLSPSPSPAPSEPPTAPPTAPPTQPSSPTPPPDTLSAEGFAQQIAAALRDGDDEYLYDHLHRAVIERYGEQACRDYVAGVEGGVGWEILGSSGPQDWSYETDGLATAIEDAWTVNVRQPGTEPEVKDVHFAQADSTWRWFTDCGTPS